jgi:hypothetical protein
MASADSNIAATCIQSWGSWGHPVAYRTDEGNQRPALMI